MKTRRFRHLITFVAAMFLANNVAAAAYACIAGLGSLAPVTAPGLESTGAGHLERAADADPLCITQCARSDRDPAQPFAANGSGPVPTPLASGPCLSVTIEPTRSRIAWAPKVPGPPLPILFCNLRN